nr:hypothetical protein [Tanacetum cinerariifolium]
MLHSKELASPKQTAIGKDVSNPLIVNSLLKTIWSSMHHVIAMKHWLFQSKRLLELTHLDVMRTVLNLGINGFLCTICVEKDRVGVTAAKSAESEGFEQIIDFLNRSSVRYALIASPTIRTSYIKQFWSTEKVKTVNDEVRVHALIDGKKVTFKESSIRRDLSALVLKPPPGMNLAALWHQQSSVLQQTRSLTSPESEVIDLKSSFTYKIEKLEDRVPKLEEENRILKEKSFKYAKSDIATPIEAKEESFKQGRMIADIDEYV